MNTIPAINKRNLKNVAWLGVIFSRRNSQVNGHANGINKYLLKNFESILSKFWEAIIFLNVYNFLILISLRVILNNFNYA